MQHSWNPSFPTYFSHPPHPLKIGGPATGNRCHHRLPPPGPTYFKGGALLQHSPASVGNCHLKSSIVASDGSLTKQQEATHESQRRVHHPARGVVERKSSCSMLATEIRREPRIEKTKRGACEQRASKQRSVGSCGLPPRQDLSDEPSL